MTTLENRQGADDRSNSHTTGAQREISTNEYEVSDLYDSSALVLPEQDSVLRPAVMSILREDTSETEDFDVSLSDNEKYKLVDDMSDEFTADLRDSTDSDDDDESSAVEKKTAVTPSAAQKHYTFHEYTQTSSSKNLVVKRIDESSGPVICRWDGCNKKYNSPEELSKHLDLQHDLSDWICHWSPCSRNLKPFDARYKLIVHLRCHTGEKPYKCTIEGCLRRFSRIENMRLHVRTHTGEKPYACGYEGCPKRFNNSSDRAKHVKTHIQTKPYKCKFPGCDKHYTDPSSMRKHFRSIHFRNEQGKQNKSNLRIHSYGSAPPAKQPHIAPDPSVTTGMEMLEDNAVSMDNQSLTINSQTTSTTMTNSNTNCNSNLVQVPVFQLPSSEPSPGNSDMSQLIQQGKIQPILLQNGDKQTMLMFVPTANMQEALGPGAALIPLLPQVHDQQQQPVSQIPAQNTDKVTITTEQSVQPANKPAKNVRVIVSSRRSKENDSSTFET